MEKIAVLCSDVHLSHTPPLARSRESDWYEAMSRPLLELRDLARDDRCLPVLCGGDLFDRWSCPPRLITFATKRLPSNFYSVMGQHDMPYHSWEQRESSAFWTLVVSGTIKLSSGWRGDGKMAWRGFQWGEEIVPMDREPDPVVTICIAHQYVWMGIDGRAANPVLDRRDNHVRVLTGKLAGYDVALFGDNHRGFLGRMMRKRPYVFNAGTLLRRHADERDYAPMVGVLFEDGSVEPYHLDTTQDVFDSSETVREAERVMLNFDSFLDELQKLGETGLDFRRAVEAAMDREQVSRAVRRVILEAMEKSDGDEKKKSR